MRRTFLFFVLISTLLVGRAIGNVSLILPHVSGAAGTQITVPVKVAGFNDIISIQGTLQFDPAIVAYVSTQQYGLPGMNATSFGTSQTGSGILTFSWFDGSLAGVSLADSAVIFSITFHIIGTSGQSSALSFINAPTLMEVVDVNFITQPLTLANGSITVQSVAPTSDLTLYLDTITSDAGSQVSISLRALDFTNINSVQGTLQWNSSVVSYAGIGFYGLPGMNISNFGTSQTGSGKLMFSWSDGTLQGQDMADSTALFTVLFNLTGSPGSQTSLDLVDVPTPVEVSDSMFQVLTADLIPGAIHISSALPSGTITIYIDTVSTPGGTAVDVSVHALDFINIISAQGTISFNTSIATLDTLVYYGLPSMDIANFGLTQVGSGKLMYSWNDPTLAGVNVADSAILFTMRFNVIGSPGTFTWLELIDVPTTQEYVDNTFTPLVEQLIDGKITVISSGTVTLDDPSALVYCPGDPFSVDFTVTGTFVAGNLFILQSSGPTGSFASPTDLDTVAGTGSGTFTGFVPLTAPAGTGYFFRVVTTNPSTISSTNPTAITILAVPGIPSTPSGATILCQDAADESYSTFAANAVSYSWVLNPPAAGTISGTGTTATVDWNSSFSGTAYISVWGLNGSCTGPISDSLAVQVTATPATPDQPVGDTLLCAGTASSVYTVVAVPGATQYNWTLNPSGAGSIAGTGTTVTVNWDPGFSGTVLISTTAFNGTCPGSASTSLTVHLLVLPGAPSIPTGTTVLCINPMDETYTVNAVPDATDYIWSLDPPAAGTLTSTMNSVVVNWDDSYVGQASLFVYAVNGSCSGPYSDTLTVTINDVPGLAGTPTGITEYCSGDASGTYITSGAPNASSYQWELFPPAAGTVIGSGTSVTIDWTPGWSGTAWLFVNGTNSCGNGQGSDSLIIAVHPLPAAPIITLFGGGTLVSSYPDGNQWFFNGSVLPGAVDSFYIPGVNGYYQVMVTDSNGCSSLSDTLDVNFVGISERSPDEKIEISPNPSDGLFYVSGAPYCHYEVWDANDRKVLEGTGGPASLMIDLRGKAKGVYLLRMLFTDHFRSFKLLLN